MNKLRVLILILALIGICAELFYVVDYSKPGCVDNIGAYIMIISMFFVIASMIVSIRYYNNKNKS